MRRIRDYSLDTEDGTRRPENATAGPRRWCSLGAVSTPTADQDPKENESWVDDWHDYAKSRYESARDSIIEFRGWARQLMGAMAVVIGLEITILLKVLELRTPWKHVGIAWLVVTVVYQLMIASRLVRLGYQMPRSLYVTPKSPRMMRLEISKDTSRARVAIAEQYAEAQRDRYSVSRKISQELFAESSGFVKSLMFGLLIAVLIAVGASFLQGPPPPPVVVISNGGT
jgi:hypothetical protein